MTSSSETTIVDGTGTMVGIGTMPNAGPYVSDALAEWQCDYQNAAQLLRPADPEHQFLICSPGIGAPAPMLLDSV